MRLDSTGKVYPTRFTDGLGVGVGWERKEDSKDFGLSQGRMVVFSPSMGKIVERAGFGGNQVHYFGPVHHDAS